MATQTLELVVENGMFRSVNGALPFADGQHVRVVVQEAEEVKTEAQPNPRIAGLHAGMGWMSDDFDAELPDSFWLGEE